MIIIGFILSSNFYKFILIILFYLNLIFFFLINFMYKLNHDFACNNIFNKYLILHD
jgi:hypothetical protein